METTERKSKALPDMPSSMIEKYGNPDDSLWYMDKAGQLQQRQSLWGFGGWYANIIDVALKNDDPEAFAFFVKSSGLDKEWLMLDGRSPENYCELRGAAKCKAAVKRIFAQ